MPQPKTDKKPFFSVILPTYNRCGLLRKAVLSIIKQEFKDWELIIIDDGSTDDTQQVIRPFLKKYDNIFYSWQENQGRGGVRNTGLKNAKGQYITFLDDDDYWLPNHLKVFWDKLQIGSEGSLLKSEGYLEQSGKRLPLTTYAHSSQKHVIQNIWKTGAQLASFCFPKSVFDEYQFDPSLYFAQDYHLIMRVVLNHNLAFTHTKTFVIVDHPDRGTYTIDEAKFEQLYHSRLIVFKYFAEQERVKLLKHMTDSEIKKRAANDYLYLANYAARVGAYEKMFNLVLKSLPMFKFNIPHFKKLLAIFYQATKKLMKV